MKFNVSGLSENCQSLQQGKTYVFSVADSNWYQILLRHIDAEKLVLLTYKNPSNAYDTLLLAQTQKQYNIYQMSFDSSHSTKVKVTSLCNELIHLKIQNSVVAIDFTESLFLSNTIEQSQQHLHLLQQWSEKSNNTLIFLFAARKHNTKVDGFLTLNQQRFAGMVDIGGTLSPQYWYVEHWFTLGHLIAEQSFSLLLNNQLLTASATTPALQSTLSPFKLQDTTVLLDEHFQKFHGKVNAQWFICANQTELLLKAQKTPHATVIVHVFSHSDTKALAQLIHTLRRSCGDTLKIIIRQVDLQLRLIEQNLLRHLGANIIIPAELTITTLNSIIDSLKHTHFVQEVTTSFESSYNKSNIPTVKGYLVANEFIKFSQKLIDTANLYAINFAVVQLFTASGLSAIDTVKYGQCLRNGDFFTIINTSVYFFLYGCREENINSTLENILGARPKTLFKAQENYVAYEAANIELTKIEQGLSSATQFDYSEQLASISTMQVNSTQEQAALKQTTNLAHPITLQFKEP